MDLPEPLALQRRYVEALGVEGVIFAVPRELDPIAEYDLVVSNYAFSECRGDAQDHYLATVLRPASRVRDVQLDHATRVSGLWPGRVARGRSRIAFINEEPLTGAANAILVWGTDAGESSSTEAWNAAGADA